MTIEHSTPPAAEQLTPVSTPWRRAIAALKRSHWVFRIPDAISARLQMQDQLRFDQAQLTKALRMFAAAQQKSAHLVRDLQRRLEHHEAGPLQASKAELDRRRGDGMIRPIEAKRNGGKRRLTKHIDASGQVADAPIGPPPPAEAADHDGDESA